MIPSLTDRLKSFEPEVHTTTSGKWPELIERDSFEKLRQVAIELSQACERVATPKAGYGSVYVANNALTKAAEMLDGEK